MHELGIARSIIEIAEEHARRHDARRIHSVTVLIGSLSGVMAEAVEFCFSACAQGTLLEDARLIIEQPQGLGRCRQCQKESPLATTLYSCPVCGSFAIDLLRGDEMRISEMEVD
jgi:hydrogenase nickel incorporation protein HypA/HybF